MDCRSASAAERVCECGEGVQCPNERKPIFFMRLHPADMLVVKADSIFAQRRTAIGLKPFLHRSPHLESQPCVLVSRSRLDAQGCNFSGARPSPHVCDDRLDAFRRAAKPRLDRTVVAISHPSCDAKSIGRTANKLAIADALDATIDGDVDFV